MLRRFPQRSVAEHAFDHPRPGAGDAPAAMAPRAPLFSFERREWLIKWAFRMGFALVGLLSFYILLLT